MKQQVNISAYSITITLLCLATMIAILTSGIRNGQPYWQTIALATAIVSICITALFYMPISISVDEKELHVNRPLWFKRIKLSEIESIRLCPPTMAEQRICGSGGWFGYWGRFKEPTIGKYFAYYGKSSDCFLVTLKNERRYMLGCKNPQIIVEHISKRISQ